MLLYEKILKEETIMTTFLAFTTGLLLSTTVILGWFSLTAVNYINDMKDEQEAEESEED